MLIMNRVAENLKQASETIVGTSVLPTYVADLKQPVTYIHTYVYGVRLMIMYVLCLYTYVMCKLLILSWF